MNAVRSERGFTLVELVVVVTLLGLLVAAIATAMHVGTRTLADPEDGVLARSASAIDEYLASTVFPTDAMATNFAVWVPPYDCDGEREDVRPGQETEYAEPAPCPEPDPQGNLLVFEVRITTDHTYSAIVAYRAEEHDGRWNLLRTRYAKAIVPDGTFADPTYQVTDENGNVVAEGNLWGREPITDYVATDTHVVASGLAEPPVLECSGPAFVPPVGGGPGWLPCDHSVFSEQPIATIRLTLTGLDGTKTALIAERRVKDPQ